MKKVRTFCLLRHRPLPLFSDTPICDQIVDDDTKIELALKALCEGVAAALADITIPEGVTVSSTEELVNALQRAEEGSSEDTKEKITKAIAALRSLKKGSATNVLFELEKVGLVLFFLFLFFR